MTGDRYVLLGLAPARSGWFDSLSQWAMSASIAAEFVKCVSVEEMLARLASGRQHSALLIDSGSPAFDRDLVDVCRAHGTPVIVVRSGRAPAYSRDDLGVAGEIDAGFDSAHLMAVLESTCRPVGRADRLPPTVGDPEPPLWLCQLFAVCGPGGTGASTAAMALAQGLAGDTRYGQRVLLADLARRADLAMLHDSDDLGPGVQELVEAHRLRRPPASEVAGITFDVPKRGYRLLLGLRQAEGWAALRPRSVDAAVTGLRQAFQAVVADLTGDFEGEAEGGSLDVEERNHVARTVTRQATVTIVVGSPGLKGVHSLAGTIRDLSRSGVAPERILAVINRSPRHPRARAECSRALNSLLEAAGIGSALASPVHLPERRVDEALRDGSPLPQPVVAPLTRAVQIVAERVSDLPPALDGPTRIAAGSLGSWSGSELEQENP